MHGFNDPVLSLLPGQASNCPPINTHSDSHPFHPPQPCRLHHTHTHTCKHTEASAHLLHAVPPRCKSVVLRATSSQLLKYIVCVVLLGIIQMVFFYHFNTLKVRMQFSSSQTYGVCFFFQFRVSHSVMCFSFRFELLQLTFVLFLHHYHTNVCVSPSISYFWDVLRSHITLWCCFLAIFWGPGGLMNRYKGSIHNASWKLTTTF